MSNILQYRTESRARGRSDSEEYAEVILMLTPEDDDYEEMKQVIKEAGYGAK